MLDAESAVTSATLNSFALLARFRREEEACENLFICQYPSSKNVCDRLRPTWINALPQMG
jgi:hypothetical protein